MNAPNRPPQVQARPDEAHPRVGFALGLAAYALWGILPLYFKALSDVAAVDIVAHRLLWSLPFLAILIPISRGWPGARAVIAQPRTLRVLTLTALLICADYLAFLGPVPRRHMLPPSVGSFL